jgi:hypothetical protein
MKRAADDTDDTNDEPPAKGAKTAAKEFPVWMKQDWEECFCGSEGYNEHAVTIAIKKQRGASTRGDYDLNNEGYIISAATSIATIKLINMPSIADKKKKCDGIQIAFLDPLHLELFVDGGGEFATFMIDGLEIEVEDKEHARIDHLLHIEGKKPPRDRCIKIKHETKRNVHTYIFCVLQISSEHEHTKHLYSALMHQYVSKHRNRMSSERLNN